MSEPGSNTYSERNIEILNSMAILHSEEEQHKEAIAILERAMAHLKALSHQKDARIEIRLLYSLANSLTIEGQYDNSIHYCQRGSKLCLQAESLYLFGEITFQCGYNLLQLNRKEEALVCLYRARNIFQLQNNVNFVSYIDEEIRYLD